MPKEDAFPAQPLALGRMYRPRRIELIVTASCLLLAVFVFLGFQHSTHGRLDVGRIADLRKGSDKGPCARELESLRQHIHMPSKIRYAKRRFTAVPSSNSKQRSIVHMEQNLMDDFTDIDIDDRECSMPDIGRELIVEYPEFTPRSEVDTSTLMFGASTTLGRLRANIPQMARWLGNATSALVVNVHDSDNIAEFEAVQNLAEDVDINIELINNLDSVLGGDRHAQRHFDIVKALYRHRGDHHQWFGIVDDDTFIPSVPALLDALNEYDWTKPHYIGTLSESWQAVRDFGYMAYGGGGIFLSRPLLDALYDKFDTCLIRGAEGDALYSDCIYEVVSPPVRLTQMNGLNQLDLRVDASGWYEGGLKPVLSLHHYNSWHKYSVEYGSLVGDICGHDCFLQRYQFADDIILTNGYSMNRYPRGIRTIDLDRVEGTFEHRKDDFDFSLGALRPPISSDDKIAFRLEYAITEANGNVRQFYIKRPGSAKTDDERLKLDVESVFEIEWSR